MALTWWSAALRGWLRVQSATFSVASRLWEFLERAVEKYRPLSLLGATQQLSGEVILFRAPVENSDCATDLVQSRLTGLQLRLAVVMHSFAQKIVG